MIMNLKSSFRSDYDLHSQRNECALIILSKIEHSICYCGLLAYSQNVLIILMEHPMSFGFTFNATLGVCSEKLLN